MTGMMQTQPHGMHLPQPLSIRLQSTYAHDLLEDVRDEVLFSSGDTVASELISTVLSNRCRNNSVMCML